ncbi:hypothetical protein PI124_g5778 [Phytophthora idaei]|nr:hypothetical protein PI125_g5279 [Phytophthora idaei]KAG3161905.1 hypothetical protein PI126_g6219 [Phytophthora idaei]KAG3249556.1 hypothetical protein PI124_g5778 [Phytophthora idaei]
MASGLEKVKVMEEYPLFCADGSSTEQLASPVLLGPLDHIAQHFVPISVAFVYRRGESMAEELIPIERFRRALERLLDFYPHLTGRIVMDDKDNTPRIDQLGAGGKLFSATCCDLLEAFEAVGEDDEPGSKPRLIVTNLPGGGNALLPPFDPSGAGMTRDPILSVQHTRFACGGVAIGICIRHIFCDAGGFFQLVRDLAELYRALRAFENGLIDNENEVKLSKPPHIRYFMAELHDMTLEERQEALQFQPVGFKLSPEVESAAAATNKLIPAPVTGRVLRFSSSELAALKAEASANNNGKPLSTFCALAAHIWLSIYRARVRLCEASMALASQVSPQILLSVNLRSRNQLRDVPPQYFPNAVFSAVLSVPTAQLLDAPLSTAAALIRDGTQPQPPTEMLKALHWIAAQPDKRRVQPCCNYEKEGVFVTQWSKFDMYQGASFEVPPALVAQPFTSSSLYDGLTCLMATEDQLRQSMDSAGVTTGSIDVNLALKEPVWTILDQDENFRRHRGW